MYFSKNKEIKDTYLDDNFPIYYLDTINEAQFQKAHQKFNLDISKKYSIEPKIAEIERKIEEEFQDRKLIQAKINEKLENEQNFHIQYNQIKKSKITPPYYHIRNERSPKKQLEKERKNEFLVEENPNKSTQTLKQPINQMFFNDLYPTAKNPDFNLTKHEGADTKTKFFNSEGKRSNDFNINCKQHKMRTSAKFCKACETKFGSPDRYNNNNGPPIYNELNKILIDAKSLIMKRKLKEADKLLENLIRKDIKHADLYYLIGETKRLLGDYEKSEEMLLKSLSFELHSPFCYYSLALVYMELKNFKRAINLWKIFLKLKENNVSGYFEIAKCYFETEAFIEAATCLNKAIDIDNQNPDFFLLRAEAFELLNLEESAKNDYKKYKLLSPNFQEKYDVEIKKLEGYGFFEEALKLKNFVKKVKSL